MVRNTPVRRTRGAVPAGVLLLAAAGLGLLAPDVQASCVGPQLALEQGGRVVEGRRVGQGDDERLRYDLARDQQLRVLGSNLTFDCQDTYSSTQRGCGAPVADPVPPGAPMQDPELVLSQPGRSWTLVKVVTVGPDLKAQVEVQLPPDVRPGEATLSLLDRQERNGAELDLVLS